MPQVNILNTLSSEGNKTQASKTGIFRWHTGTSILHGFKLACSLNCVAPFLALRSQSASDKLVPPTCWRVFKDKRVFTCSEWPFFFDTKRYRELRLNVAVLEMSWKISPWRHSWCCTQLYITFTCLVMWPITIETWKCYIGCVQKMLVADPTNSHSQMVFDTPTSAVCKAY